MKIYSIVLTELATKKLQSEAELERLINLNTTTASDTSIGSQVGMILVELDRLISTSNALEKWISLNPNKETTENK